MSPPLRTLLLPLAIALAGLTLLGLCAGDPRASRDIGSAALLDLAGLAIGVAVGVAAWRLGRRRPLWLMVPVVVLAVAGGLCGWIAGAEFTLAPDVAVHLSMPGRVAFMLALTAIGMALPSAGLVLLAGIRRRRG